MPSSLLLLIVPIYDAVVVDCSIDAVVDDCLIDAVVVDCSDRRWCCCCCCIGDRYKVE